MQCYANIKWNGVIIVTYQYIAVIVYTFNWGEHEQAPPLHVQRRDSVCLSVGCMQALCPSACQRAGQSAYAWLVSVPLSRLPSCSSCSCCNLACLCYTVSATLLLLCWSRSVSIFSNTQASLPSRLRHEQE